MTGIPAAVGAQLLARHGRAAVGFVDPEEYYKPVEFLTHLERRPGIAIESEEFVIPQEYSQPYVKASPA